MSYQSRSGKISCVYKIVERCNINCSYCYFFYGGDESYKKHPPYASLETTKSFADFLRQGCLDLNLKKVTIGYHGGEPLMIGADNLSQMCDIFIGALSDIADVEFTLQTNGILINDDWIAVFKKYGFRPGISLDGPKVVNDVYRLDKRGRSTYERTVAGIKKLVNSDLDYQPAVLSVINPHSDPRKIYRHFVDKLNIKSMDFLLPHASHDSHLPGTPEQYGKFLCDLFNEWTKDDNPKINIRFVDDALESFAGGYSSVYGRGYNDLREPRNPLLNVSSNGDLGPVSELMTTSSEVMYTGFNVKTHTLAELLALPVFQQIAEALRNVADKCQKCCWKRVCNGGDLVTRYRKENGFDNPSSLCEGLSAFYADIAVYMLKNGFKKEAMLTNLGIQLPP